MKLPLLWVAVALLIGIAALGVLPVPLLLGVGVVAASAVAGLVFAWRGWLWPAWAWALATWILLGGLAARLESIAVPQNSISQLIATDRLDTSEPLRWRGQLRRDPIRLPWGTRYEIALDEVDVAGQAMQVSGGLRASHFSNPKAPEAEPAVRAGERIEVLVRAHPVRNFLDPGAFDARKFLARQGIDLTGSLRSADLLQKIGSPPLKISHRLARIDGALLARVDALFPSREAAVMRAMLLGDRNFVDSELAAEFQKTAAYHVLVIAGLHVGALAVFLVWLGRRLRLSPALTILLTLALLALYVAVVEDRPPVLRAGLMAAVYLLARLFFRRVALGNAIALAALILLLARPSAFTDASFQLSFVSAGVIAALALPWIGRSSAPYLRGLQHVTDVTRDGAFPPRVVQFRIELRDAARWLPAKLPRPLAGRAPQLLTGLLSGGFRLWEIIVLSLALQLGLVPLMAFYFHRISLSGPLANLPAVLLVGLIVPLGFATLLASFVWYPLGAFGAKIMTVLVKALLLSVEWLGHLRWGSYRIPGPPAWLIAVFFALLGLMALAVRPSVARRRWAWIVALPLGAAALAVMIYPFPPHLHKGQMEVTVLDVGQGDSIFVAFPQGHTMLIDGGGQPTTRWIGGYRTGFDIGEEVVAPYLWSRGLKRLDVVALTHAHGDHLEGLNAVIDDLRVRELWVGRDVDTRPYDELIARAHRRGVQVVHQLRGSSFTWDGVAGQILWPADATKAATATNNDSVVLRLEDSGVSFLLPGDIEQAVEKKLVADGDRLAATFLKVPHHGSRTSAVPEFLTSVAPHIAVVSAGANNPFGHPHPAVVAQYERAGVHLWRTDRDGAVTALTDGHNVEVHSYAEQAQP